MEKLQERKNNIKLAVSIIVAIVIGLILWSLISPAKTAEPEQTTITQIVDQVKNGNVAQISIADNQVTATLKDNQKFQAYKESSSSLNDYGITPDKVNIKVQNTNTGTNWTTVFGPFLTLLLIGAIFFVLRQVRRIGYIPAIGILMIIGGIATVIYFSMFFDTSVAMPTTEIFGQTIGGGQVNNLALMNERSNGIMIGIGAAIFGLILPIVAKTKLEK